MRTIKLNRRTLTKDELLLSAWCVKTINSNGEYHYQIKDGAEITLNIDNDYYNIIIERKDSK